MLIELLYLDDCPGHETVILWIREILPELDKSAEFKMIHVRNPTQAEELKFVGSPTIRIDGQEVFPSEDKEYGMKYRMFEGKRGENSFPPRKLIEEALRRGSA